MTLSKYTKSITAALGVAATLLYQFNLTNPNHWVTTILGILTVLGVYQLPNSK